jgi:hypothetical protein
MPMPTTPTTPASVIAVVVSSKRPITVLTARPSRT